MIRNNGISHRHSQPKTNAPVRPLARPAKLTPELKAKYPKTIDKKIIEKALKESAESYKRFSVY